MSDDPPLAAQSLDAWRLVRTMLDDMTALVQAEAETELELVEGLRVLGRVTALCAELSLDVDVEAPWFFSMNSEARYVGGPDPNGAYHLAMIDGHHRYRISGTRGTVAYLGFQVLAGTGLTPRRMATYLSDHDLDIADDGTFSFVVSAERPPDDELAGAPWVAIPADASAIVVRQYIADATTEHPASFAIESLDPPGPPARPTDSMLAEQLTAMAWTIWKLTTLYQTIKPELLDRPNELVTAEAGELGAADTTPDNLYMIGTFRLEGDEALVLDIDPPATRYWSVTVENIWHECIDVRRRRSSLTNATAVSETDGSVRVLVGATDPGSGNWLDTGGRHRGFILLRWLDHPTAPDVTATVTSGNEP
jgi:hypothetical protein